ncbi:MAG TPA: GNAT family N-acetyltransferase [Mycobacteriales bacterium]|nr:GNAT family N-acetyltransferase [Mycobacteriales bacterium]
MTRLIVTTDPPQRLLAAVRAMVDAAFGDGFTDDDWDHALGGTHVVLLDGDTVVAHAAVVPRTLVVEATITAGYVEAVATRPDRQREGHGAAVMREAAAQIRAHYPLGVLSTSRHAFYERLGWERWRGKTFVRDGGTLRRTADEDAGIMVLRTALSATLDLASAMACDARAGDDW